MVWAGICHHKKTELVTILGTLTAVRYCDEIIQPVVLPFLQQSHGTIFQQDNTRPHSARHTRNVLRQHNVTVLEWPSRSPDLSPMEHLWDYLGRRVRMRADVNNVGDLKRVLREEWRRIPMNTVRKLIDGMRKRCRSVLQAQGGHTRY